MGNLFQKFLTKIYENFHADTAKMLIYTGIAGYALSSLAQIAGIAFSSKFSNEQKSFLIPQESGDALANIGTFLAITTMTKKTVLTLFKTGKWGTKSVKEFLNSKPELAKRIGNLDFDVEKYLTDKTLLNNYNSCKALGTTVATIVAGIVSSSIITPIIRNNLASKRQKQYIANMHNYEKTEKHTVKSEPAFKSTYMYTRNYNTDLRI